MQKLPTWSGKSSFSYDGNIQHGTLIVYGKGWTVNVSSDLYKRLLQRFKGKVVPCGTSRTNPPKGSLGEWLMENVSKTATASYVASILVHEGYAIRRLSDIIFLRVPVCPDSLSFLRSTLQLHTMHLEIGGKSPFDIDSESFLNFAKEDLRNDTRRGRANALTNIKKAVECRMDELLYFYWLDKLARGLNFPKKMQMLREIGIVAPNILRKINRLRNQLEHEYKEFPKGKIEDFFDVALLYLDSTRKYIEVFKIIMRAQSWFSVTRENDTVVISKVINESNKPQFPTVKINIDSRNEWLKVAKELVSLATSAINSL